MVLRNNRYKRSRNRRGCRSRNRKGGRKSKTRRVKRRKYRKSRKSRKSRKRKRTRRRRKRRMRGGSGCPYNKYQETVMFQLVILNKKEVQQHKILLKVLDLEIYGGVLMV